MLEAEGGREFYSVSSGGINPNEIVAIGPKCFGDMENNYQYRELTAEASGKKQG